MDQESSRGSRGREGIPAKNQSQERHGERKRLVGARRQRKVDRERQEGRRQERGREVGSTPSPKDGTNQTLPLSGRAEAGPLSTGLPGAANLLPAGAEASKSSDTHLCDRRDLLDSADGSYELPCSSGAFGERLLRSILGSASCGFSELVSLSCGAEEEKTAEGRDQRKIDLFPLPLPGKHMLDEYRQTGNMSKVWLYVLICGLNYLHSWRYGKGGTTNTNSVSCAWLLGGSC